MARVQPCSIYFSTQHDTMHHGDMQHVNLRDAEPQQGATFQHATWQHATLQRASCSMRDVATKLQYCCCVRDARTAAGCNISTCNLATCEPKNMVVAHARTHARPSARSPAHTRHFCGKVCRLHSFPASPSRTSRSVVPVATRANGLTRDRAYTPIQPGAATPYDMLPQCRRRSHERSCTQQPMRRCRRG